jgi:hypothetical protein
MRRIRLIATGTCATGAALLLTGCLGGSGASGSAATATVPAFAAVPTAFCKTATDAFNELSPAFSSQAGHPDALAPLLTQAEARLTAIQPPAALAADWTKLGDVIHQFADAYGALPSPATATTSAFAQRNTELLSQLTPVAQRIQAYMSQHCNLVGSSGATTHPPPRPADPVTHTVG